MKKRQANMELLRIIAMMMVVLLHYLGKGEVLVPLEEDRSILNLLLWLIEAACIVTTNVYVLISGYFLLETRWKVSRLASVVIQTLCYSVFIPVVCLALGIGDVKQWGLYDWVNVIFPIQMEHYWFMTAYVVLYLLVPVLAAGVRQMTQKQHKMVMIGLLLVFSVFKSILPVSIPTDHYGYDFGWFLFLFLVAAYIRKYGISFYSHKSKAWTAYFVSVGLVLLAAVLYGILTSEGYSFAYAMNMTYSYNHILVFIGSVSLFYAFLYLRIPQGRVSDIICRISPYTLGVYLLHENLALRYQWQAWAGIENAKGKFTIFPHMLLTVLAIFTAGIMVDFVRDCIFKYFIRVWKRHFAGRNAQL